MHLAAQHIGCQDAAPSATRTPHAGRPQGSVRGPVRALMEAQVAPSRWSPTRCGLVPRLPRAPGAPPLTWRAVPALCTTACAVFFRSRFDN